MQTLLHIQHADDLKKLSAARVSNHYYKSGFFTFLDKVITLVSAKNNKFYVALRLKNHYLIRIYNEWSNKFVTFIF